MRRLLPILAFVFASMLGWHGAAVADESVLFVDSSPERRAIEARLAEPIDLEFAETALTTVVDRLREATKLDVRLDQRALEEAGIASDTSVTLRLKGVSLRSALNLMLRDFEMTWVIRDKALLLTTDTEAESIAETALYPVADLLDPPWRQAPRSRTSDFNALIEVIAAVVQPASWADVGGTMTMRADAATKSLLINQTRAGHDEIASLLAELRRARDEQFFLDREPMPRKDRDVLARERINQCLARTVEFEWEAMPLDAAMRKAGEQAGVDILLDQKALAEWGVEEGVKLGARSDGLTLRDALRRALRPSELTFIIRDKVLLITTTAASMGMRDIRVYPVRDLLASRYGGAEDDALVVSIASTVSDVTWTPVGGEGVIRRFPNAAALVILQTDEVHEGVADFLTLLRKAKRLGAAKKAELAQTAQPHESRPASERSAGDEWTLVVHPLPAFPAASRTGKTALTEIGPNPPRLPATSGMGSVFDVPDTGANSKAAPKVPATTARPAPQPRVASATAETRDVSGQTARDLAEIIPKLIEPASWEPAGGQGLIFPVTPTGSSGMLIVKQTRHVHDQIDALLDQMAE